MALKREQTGALLELYFEAEERIIEDMARRIAAYDYFIPAAQHQMKSLEQMGKCRADIYQQLSELTGRSENELAAMLRQTVADNLAIDREIYKANKLDADAAMGSAGVARELKAGFEQTNGTLKNITGTTARLGAVQFQNELDNAWMMVSSGAFSPDEAVRQAVNRLSDSGVKAVKYDSGRTLSLEAAVSMCVATGAAQTAAKSRIALAGEVGCDLVEVTAHAGARPEHAEWQGSICSLSGKSRKYPSLREHTGYGTVTGLCGANCAHSFFPWFEGSSRNWTEDELARLNEPKYEWGGKKLTEYEASQVQRGIERNIRAYKRRVVGLEAAGQDSAAAATKVREWQSRQREFLAATGLKRKSAREQVAGTLGLQKPLERIASLDTQTVIQRLQEYEKGAILEQKETACVITKSGEVYKVEGTEKHVYPDELLGEKLRGAWVSHNHTREETEYSFSDDDITLFREYDLTVLRGCDEKYTYELNRNADDIDDSDNVDWQSEEGFRHCKVVDIAKENSFGYRRRKNEEG